MAVGRAGRFGGWMVRLVLVALVLAAGTGCTESSDLATRGTLLVTPPPGFDADGRAGIGQTIAGDGLEVRLAGAELTDAVPGLPASPAGRRYLVIRVESTRPSASRFYLLLDGDDHGPGGDVGLAGVPLPAATEPTAPAATSAPGQPVPAAYAFSVPADDDWYTLGHAWSTPDGHYNVRFWWIAGLPAPAPGVVSAERCGDEARARELWAEVGGASRSESSETAVVVGVAGAVERLVACVNAGDRERLKTLVTDGFVARHPEIAALADPAAPPLPPRSLTVTTVEAVHWFPSEEDPYGSFQVSAVVGVADPERPEPTVFTLVSLKLTETGWLVDGMEWDPWLIEALGR